jgi:hypothetical protein
VAANTESRGLVPRSGRSDSSFVAYHSYRSPILPVNFSDALLGNGWSRVPPSPHAQRPSQKKHDAGQ